MTDLETFCRYDLVYFADEEGALHVGVLVDGNEERAEVRSLLTFVESLIPWKDVVPFRKYKNFFLRKSSLVKGVDDLRIVTLRLIAARDRLEEERRTGVINQAVVHTRKEINDQWVVKMKGKGYKKVAARSEYAMHVSGNYPCLALSVLEDVVIEYDPYEIRKQRGILFVVRDHLGIGFASGYDGGNIVVMDIHTGMPYMVPPDRVGPLTLFSELKRHLALSTPSPNIPEKRAAGIIRGFESLLSDRVAADERLNCNELSEVVVVTHRMKICPPGDIQGLDINSGFDSPQITSVCREFLLRGQCNASRLQSLSMRLEPSEKEIVGVGLEDLETGPARRVEVSRQSKGSHALNDGMEVNDPIDNAEDEIVSQSHEPEVILKDLDSDDVNSLAKTKCKWCEFTTDSAAALLLHMGSHFSPEEFVCPHDFQKFSSKPELDLHLLQHQQSSQKASAFTIAHSCSHCSGIFSDKAMNHHLCTVHNYVQCFVCRAVSSTQDGLRKHIRRNHSGANAYVVPSRDDANGALQGPFERCPRCDEWIIQHPYNKRTHNLENHLDDISGSCPYCAAVQFSIPSLHSHISRCVLRKKYPTAKYWVSIRNMRAAPEREPVRLDQLKALAQLKPADRVSHPNAPKMDAMDNSSHSDEEAPVRPKRIRVAAIRIERSPEHNLAALPSDYEEQTSDGSTDDTSSSQVLSDSSKSCVEERKKEGRKTRCEKASSSKQGSQTQVSLVTGPKSVRAASVPVETRPQCPSASRRSSGALFYSPKKKK